MNNKINFFQYLKTNEYINYKSREFIALLVIVLVWFIINATTQFLNILPKFILSFAIMVFFITLTALLIRKLFFVLILLLTATLLIKSLPDLSGLGHKSIVIMLIVGIIFELLYLLLNLKFKSISFNVIASVLISISTIPFWTGILLSPTLVSLRIVDIINLMLLDFFIAIIAVLLAFLFWFHIKVYKLFVLFEYAP